jgi:predicted nucleotide-binding protein
MVCHQMTSIPVDLPLPKYPQGEQPRPKPTTNPAQNTNNKNIFIVHGHDEISKLSLAHFLHGLKLNPIILHDEPNRGRTLIEKFEQNAVSVGYAFVLLTPDDVGGDSGVTSLRYCKPRARQNVILELGFFMGALGRDRVCYVYGEGVEFPSDIYGVAYLSYHRTINECFTGVMRELKHAGYDVNL